MNLKRANSLLFGILGILFFTTTQSMENVLIAHGTQIVPYNCSAVNTAPGAGISSFLQAPPILGDQLQRAFFSSISLDSPLTIECYLDLGIDITTRDARGRNALHRAAEQNSINAAVYLLEKGIPVNAKYDFDVWTGCGISALHETASNGSSDFVKLLLDYGAFVDARDDKGRTALHRATVAGHADVVLVLLEHDAQVNARYATSWLWSTGTTVLHEAVEHGFRNIAKLLITQGVDLDYRNRNGKTALHLAVEKNDEEMVQVLLEAQPNLEICDFDGMSAYDYAIDRNNQNIADLILAVGGHMHRTPSLFPLRGVAAAPLNEDVGKSLCHAIEKGDLPLIKNLLTPLSSQDISALNCDEPLLIKAARKADPMIVRELLKHGLPVNEAMRDGLKIAGVTALHEAAYWGNLETVDELINNGAFIHAKLKIGGMAGIEAYLELVFGMYDRSKLESAEDGGMKFSESADDCSDFGLTKESCDFNYRSGWLNERGGWLNGASLLVDKRIQSNVKMFEGFTPLHFALLNRHRDVVFRLAQVSEIPGEDVSFLEDFKKTRVWAWNVLGDYYAGAHGEKGDICKAKDLYEKVASQTLDLKLQVGAWLKLGQLYAGDRGIHENLAKSKDFFEKVSGQTIDLKMQVTAWLELGRIYAGHQGGYRDLAKSNYFYEKVASQVVDISAWLELAGMYRYGRDVERDNTRARELYEKISSQDINVEIRPWAWVAIGNMYRKVSKDYVKAREFYELAANQDYNKEAQAGAWWNLGDLYCFGLGVPQNSATAKYYYKGRQECDPKDEWLDSFENAGAKAYRYPEKC